MRPALLRGPAGRFLILFCVDAEGEYGLNCLRQAPPRIQDNATVFTKFIQMMQM